MGSSYSRFVQGTRVHSRSRWHRSHKRPEASRGTRARALCLAPLPGTGRLASEPAQSEVSDFATQLGGRDPPRPALLSPLVAEGLLPPYPLSPCAIGCSPNARILRGEDGSAMRTIRCEHLVVATGKNAVPRCPTTVLGTLQHFPGVVLHSSQVSGLEALAKQRVCIVGLGNSAGDLATGGLRKTWGVRPSLRGFSPSPERRRRSGPGNPLLSRMCRFTASPRR